MPASLLRDINFRDAPWTPKGQLIGGWWNATNDAYITNDNGPGINDVDGDPARQCPYCKIVNAGGDSRVMMTTGTNSRLTVGNGGDSHYMAVLMKPLAITDVLRLTIMHDLTGSGNYFQFLLDPGSDGSHVQYGVHRIDADIFGAVGAWTAASIPRNVLYWMVLAGSRSGSNYRVRAYFANKDTPATPLTSGGVWSSNVPDGTDAGHVGITTHGFGINRGWPSWAGGIYRAINWIALPFSSLDGLGVFLDFENTTDTQIALKALRPWGGTEPYACDTWYRHTNLDTAKTSPASGVALTGTLDGCTDTTAVPGVLYHYVRKVTDAAPATVYSQPCSCRLARVTPLKLGLIGTSEWAITPQVGPYAGGVVGSEFGAGGSPGTGGSLLERALRRNLCTTAAVSNKALAGSTWNSWATGQTATAIGQLNGLPTGPRNAFYITMGENDVQGTSPLTDAQSVVDQIKAAFPSARIFVGPPIFPQGDTVYTTAQVQNIRNNWKSVRAGLTGVIFVAENFQDDFAVRLGNKVGPDGLHMAEIGIGDASEAAARGIAGALDGTSAVARRVDGGLVIA
jgi:hypothetical protein